MYLGIETSSKNCSVALWNSQGLIGCQEQSNDAFVHAELLHEMIDALMIENQLKYEEIEAVVVGRGPGSYTGLRIGVSCAKGIAYSLNVPIYSISTLILMGIGSGILENKKRVLLVMDARRNEVFGSWFAEGVMEEPQAIIFDEQTLQGREEAVVIVGENAKKLVPFLRDSDSTIDTLPSAKFMSDIQAKPWIMKEDLAYFEPQYVKAFIPTVAKKL